jgi:hypothetical protein
MAGGASGSARHVTFFEFTFFYFQPTKNQPPPKKIAVRSPLDRCQRPVP